MPDFQGRKDFPEVADDKINIGDLRDGGFLVQRDIYSPKEKPVLQDRMRITPEELLKDIFSMIADSAKEAKKLEKAQIDQVNSLVDDYYSQKRAKSKLNEQSWKDLEKGIINSIDTFLKD